MALPKPAHSIADLPQRPASDFKKVGWGGVSQSVQKNGRLVVTYHDHPQAVIMSVEEYERLNELAHSAETRLHATIETLNASFGERLASLRSKGASKRLESIMRKPAKLGGKVKAGTRY